MHIIEINDGGGPDQFNQFKKKMYLESKDFCLLNYVMSLSICYWLELKFGAKISEKEVFG